MTKRIFSITLFLTGLLFGQTYWQDNGTALRQGVHIEWQKSTAGSEPGTAIFVWSDVRNGIRDVYAQKIDTTGGLLWGAEGLAVTTSPGRQEDPVAITDGNGGAFIAWVDYRNGDMSDIYIQHLDSDGNQLMDPDGVPLCTVERVQISISMCTDSLGGVYVTWQDKRNGVDEDIYGTHVGADHSIVAPGNGVAIATGSGAQNQKTLEYAGDNQALIAWKDSYSENTNIFAQRLDAAMNLLWTAPEQVAVEDALESLPRTTFLRGDTSIVAWLESGSSEVIRYQLLDSSGVVFTSAKYISNYPSEMGGPRVKRDDQGNVFIIWSDFRHDPIEGRFYVQKIDPAGDIAWDSAGVALDISASTVNQSRLSADEQGGLWCSWEEGVFPEIDINVQHVDSSGTVTLGSEGMAVLSAPGYQFGPIMLPDGGNGTFLAIGDQQTGSIDLTAQRIDRNGSVSFGESGLTLKLGLDGDVNYAEGFSFNSSSVFMLWEDGRSDKHLFGMAVDSSGSQSGIINGTDLVAEPIFSESEISEPAYLKNGDNFYLASYSIAGGSKSLRINKVNQQLENLWNPAGVVVYQSFADQQYVKLIPAGDGVAVIWSEIRNFIDYDVFLQTYDADGNPQLADGGVALTSVSWTSEYVQNVFPADNGEFIITWMEDVYLARNLYAQRFTPNGMVASGWPFTPVPLSTASGDQQNAKGVSMGDDGILVIWEDLRSGSVDLYGQILGWDGSLAWEADGRAVSTAANDQTNPSLAYDSYSRRAVIVWEDFRDGLDFNILAQLVDTENGSLLDSNFVVCDQDKYQSNPSVEAVFPGTFLFAWEDERGVEGATPVVSGGMDVYMQIYQEGFDMLYADGGVPVCQEFHNQLLPKTVRVQEAANASDDRWLLYWHDLRSSGKADIVSLYGQLISVGNVLSSDQEQALPSEFRVGSAYPNPFNGSVRFDIEIAEIAPVSLTVYNLLGQAVYSEKMLPLQAGRYEIDWNGRSSVGDELPSGVYLYSIGSSGIQSSGKITYLK